MKAMFLALALINAPAADQELMLADLIDADPVLAVDVLDSVDELLQSDGKCLPWHRGFVVNAEIVHDAGGKSIVLDDTTVGVTGGHQDKAWSPTVR